jgi:hypothetical protein
MLPKLRWRIERDYQELKQEVGLGHFEGRGWRGFHHHATMCIATYGLVSERETIPPSGPVPPPPARDWRETPAFSLLNSLLRKAILLQIVATLMIRKHQFCLAHLIRDAQSAIDHGDTIFASQLEAFLKDACAVGYGGPISPTARSQRIGAATASWIAFWTSSRPMSRGSYLRATSAVTVGPAAAPGVGRLDTRIDKLDTKIDSVESNPAGKISRLDTRLTKFEEHEIDKRLATRTPRHKFLWKSYVRPRASIATKMPATKAPASMPSGLRLVIASSSEANVVTCCEADLAISPAAALALPTAAWPRSTASPTAVFTVSVIASTC